MYGKILAIFVLVAMALPVSADKPEWAGKGKPTAEQKAAHKAAMNAKDEYDDDVLEVDDEEREKPKDKEMKKSKEKLKGMEKQVDMKSEQPRKEVEKGAESGQASRDEHARKWWKFWEE
ncbi:MAG: hypothetical protein AseanaTS_00460 [Candidatus Pelagadaptatus aseana]|uniref:hypothetical protein n=1 Tax=Candidatus Pelagadaptatus aseana TaxID=3120508 RepID=UPI0039B25629